MSERSGDFLQDKKVCSNYLEDVISVAEPELEKCDTDRKQADKKVKEGIAFLKQFYETRNTNNITRNTIAGSAQSQESAKEFAPGVMYSKPPAG